MTVKFGVVNWEDFDFASKKRQKGEGDAWMRLQPGHNHVRLLTKPYVYMQHKFREKGDKGFGDKIMCSMYHGECPVCALHTDDNPQTAKPRWFVGLIDRKTDQYKVLDMTWLVYSGIMALNENDAWGDPTTYDIDITVNPDGGPSRYYQVMPLGKSNLSPSDLEKKQKINLDSLQEKCTPPLPSEVASTLVRVRAKKNGSQPQHTTQAQAQPDTSSRTGQSSDVYDFRKEKEFVNV